jgi:chromatin remodeling complex protein RSC6
MAKKGEGASLNSKFKIPSYQIVDMFELAKAKAKARQPSSTCPTEWFFRRPVEFLNAVISYSDSDASIVELFGDSLHDRVAVISPGIPTGFVPSLSSDFGIVKDAKTALAGEGKVSLRGLCAKLRKYKVGSETKDDAIESSLDNFSTVSGISWKDDDDHVRVIAAVAEYSLKGLSAKSKNKKKRARIETSGRKRHGIAAASEVSPELLEFLGEPAGTTIARTEVVKRINVYIKANNLKDGRWITMDSKLQSLLAPPEGEKVSFFNLCKFLSKHFPKSAKRQKLEDDAIAASELETSTPAVSVSA